MTPQWEGLLQEARRNIRSAQRDNSPPPEKPLLGSVLPSGVADSRSSQRALPGSAWKWSPWKGTPSHSNTNSQRATECESFSPAPVTTFCGCKFQIINSKLVTEELLNLFGSRILAALKAETRIDPLISDLIIGAENNVWALALWQSLGKGR